MIVGRILGFIVFFKTRSTGQLKSPSRKYFKSMQSSKLEVSKVIEGKRCQVKTI